MNISLPLMTSPKQITSSFQILTLFNPPPSDESEFSRRLERIKSKFDGHGFWESVIPPNARIERIAQKVAPGSRTTILEDLSLPIPANKRIVTDMTDDEVIRFTKSGEVLLQKAMMQNLGESNVIIVGEEIKLLSIFWATWAILKGTKFASPKMETLARAGMVAECDALRLDFKNGCACYVSS